MELPTRIFPGSKPKLPTIILKAHTAGRRTVALYRLLQNVPLGREEIRRLTDAYERTLSALSVKDRNDPLAEFIAKKIFEIGQTDSGTRRKAPLAQSRNLDCAKRRPRSISRFHRTALGAC